MRTSRILTTLTLFLGTLTAHTQLSPKTVIAGLHSNMEKYERQDVRAQGGILIAEGLALGGYLQRSYFESSRTVGGNTTTYEFGLFSRFYLLREGKVLLYLEGGIFTGNRSLSSESDVNRETQFYKGWYGSGGLDLLLSSSAALEGQLNLRRPGGEDEAANTNEVLASLGLKLFLPPSKRAYAPYFSSGMFMLGGRGALELKLDDANNDANLFFNPITGYLLSPRWMIGGAMDAAFDDGRKWQLALSPFVRFYINPDGRLKLYAEGRAGLARYNRWNRSSSQSLLSAGPGLDIFLTPIMALEAALLYQTEGGITEFNGRQGQILGSLALRAFLGGRGQPGGCYYF